MENITQYVSDTMNSGRPTLLSYGPSLCLFVSYQNWRGQHQSYSEPRFAEVLLILICKPKEWERVLNEVTGHFARETTIDHAIGNAKCDYESNSLTKWAPRCCL